MKYVCAYQTEFELSCVLRGLPVLLINQVIAWDTCDKTGLECQRPKQVLP